VFSQQLLLDSQNIEVMCDKNKNDMSKPSATQPLSHVWSPVAQHTGGHLMEHNFGEHDSFAYLVQVVVGILAL
jgi:hypothetical protein